MNIFPKSKETYCEMQRSQYVSSRIQHYKSRCSGPLSAITRIAPPQERSLQIVDGLLQTKQRLLQRLTGAGQHHALELRATLAEDVAAV